MSATGTETDAGQKPVIALYSASQLDELAEVIPLRYIERDQMHKYINQNDLPGARKQVAIALAERHREGKLPNEGYFAFEGLGLSLKEALNLCR